MWAFFLSTQPVAYVGMTWLIHNCVNWGSRAWKWWHSGYCIYSESQAFCLWPKTSDLLPATLDVRQANLMAGKLGKIWLVVVLDVFLSPPLPSYTRALLETKHYFVRKHRQKVKTCLSIAASSPVMPFGDSQVR